MVKATEVTVGLAESNGSLLPGLWRDSLHVTCGLTACTPGSAPGSTLGNEYGKSRRLLQKPGESKCRLFMCVSARCSVAVDGSVAEWLACWTQAQKNGLGLYGS